MIKKILPVIAILAMNLTACKNSELITDAVSPKTQEIVVTKNNVYTSGAGSVGIKLHKIFADNGFHTLSEIDSSAFPAPVKQIRGQIVDSNGNVIQEKITQKNGDSLEFENIPAGSGYKIRLFVDNMANEVIGTGESVTFEIKDGELTDLKDPIVLTINLKTGAKTGPIEVIRSSSSPSSSPSTQPLPSTSPSPESTPSPTPTPSSSPVPEIKNNPPVINSVEIKYASIVNPNEKTNVIFNVNITDEDSASVYQSVSENGIFLADNASTIITAGAGTHTYKILERDKQGLETTVEKTIVIQQNTPPIINTINFSQMSGEVVAGASLEINLNASFTDPQGVTGTSWYNNGNLILNTASGSVKVPIGENNLEFRATDSMGLQSVSSAKVIVTEKKPTYTYTQDKLSTTTGGGTYGSLLNLGLVRSGNKGIFIIEKQSGKGVFEQDSIAEIRVGSINGPVKGSVNIYAKDQSFRKEITVDFDATTDQWGGGKQFIGVVTNRQTGVSFVGPITVFRTP